MVLPVQEQPANLTGLIEGVRPRTQGPQLIFIKGVGGAAELEEVIHTGAGEGLG